MEYPDFETVVQPQSVPYSREAEESLVGCIILDPHLIKEVDVKPDDFYIRRLGMIWSAFQEMSTGDQVIDFVTLSDTLKRLGKLEEVGGVGYLTALTNVVPTSYHVQEYANLVREYAQRRGIIQIASGMVRTAYDLQSNLDIAQTQFADAFISNTRVKGGAVPIEQWLSDGLDLITENIQNPRKSLVKTGFIDCDDIFKFYPSGLYIISGKPGLGKTIFLKQIVLNNGKDGNPGAFYSSEMEQEAMTYRILANQTGVKVSDMWMGDINEAEMSHLVNAYAEVGTYPIYVSDSTNWTLASLRADLTRLKYEHEIVYFAFDYLELMNDEHGESDYQRSNYIAHGLQKICRDLNLVGFVIQAMNKAGFKGVPNLEDLTGGSGLSYVAPSVILLNEHIPAKGMSQDKTKITGVIRKGRFLESSKRIFHLQKVEGRPKFGDAARDTDVEKEPPQRGMAGIL